MRCTYLYFAPCTKLFYVFVYVLYQQFLRNHKFNKHSNKYEYHINISILLFPKMSTPLDCDVISTPLLHHFLLLLIHCLKITYINIWEQIKKKILYLTFILPFISQLQFSANLELHYLRVSLILYQEFLDRSFQSQFLIYLVMSKSF